MSTNKTRPEQTDVEAFLGGVEPKRRDDARALCALLGEIAGQPPVMWGTSIVGFGNYHYRYASGREGDTFVVGFSPRKQNLTLYIVDGIERHAERLAQLGPHTLGKGCLYIKSLGDVDLAVLRTIVAEAVARVGQPTDGAGR
jgi:transcription termination factor NusB